jgi:hypothetical protein
VTTYLLVCLNLDCRLYARLVYAPDARRHCTECGSDLWASDSKLETYAIIPFLERN